MLSARATASSARALRVGDPRPPRKLRRPAGEPARAHRRREEPTISQALSATPGVLGGHTARDRQQRAGSRVEVDWGSPPPSRRSRERVSLHAGDQSSAQRSRGFMIETLDAHWAAENRRRSPGMPFSTCTPRSTKDRPDPATRSFTVLETSTCRYGAAAGG